MKGIDRSISRTTVPRIRGEHPEPRSIFSDVSAERRILKDHLLRAIRAIRDDVLADMSRLSGKALDRQDYNGATSETVIGSRVRMKTDAVATLAAFIVTLALPVSAQWLKFPTAGVPRLPDGSPDLAAPAARTSDGRPDLSGLWEADATGGNVAPVVGGSTLPPEFQDIAARLNGGLPYRPWALELRNARQAENGKNNPDGLCLPLSILQLHSHPFPRRIVQVPGLVAILYEKNIDYRQIFTDARPLPVDPQPSWFGYSSGKWDGETLVVQTNGFREGLWADGAGNALTEAATVTERFRRPNFGRLEIEVTVDDPKAYTSPWTVQLSQHIKLDTELLEYVCLENEKSQAHMVGK